MNNVELVKATTDAFCDNQSDQSTLTRSFAPSFEYWSNGTLGNLKSYSESLANYMKDYEGFSIPAWDELFAADDDKVVAAYRLDGRKKGGGTDSMYVMAVWRVKDGEIVSLRQVLAPL